MYSPKFDPSLANPNHIKEYLEFYLKQLLDDGSLVAEIIEPLLVTNELSGPQIGSGIRLRLRDKEIIEGLERDIVRLKEENNELKSFIINSGK